MHVTGVSLPGPQYQLWDQDSGLYELEQAFFSILSLFCKIRGTKFSVFSTIFV